MLSDHKLDERQLYLRGNIFKNTVVFIFIILFVNMAVRDVYGPWTPPGRYESQIIFMALVTFMTVQMILKDIYQLPLLYIIVMGLCSLVLLLLPIAHVVQGQPLLEGGCLSQNGTSFATGLVMLPLAPAYLMQAYRAKKEEQEG